MTERGVRPGTGARRSGSGRQPVITVVALDDDYSGALAYALECALFMPTAVRVVRGGPASGLQRPSPLPVLDLGVRPSASLTQLSACSDRMVAQCQGREAHRVLVELRRNTYSPLVEVDENGIVLRVSDPRGWSMPAAASAAG